MSNDPWWCSVAWPENLRNVTTVHICRTNFAWPPKCKSRWVKLTCTFLLAVGNHQLAERTRQELEQLDSQIEYHRFMAQKRYNNNPPRWPPPTLTHSPRTTVTHSSFVEILIYMLDFVSFTEFYLSRVEQWMESVRGRKKCILRLG